VGDEDLLRGDLVLDIAIIPIDSRLKCVHDKLQKIVYILEGVVNYKGYNYLKDLGARVDRESGKAGFFQGAFDSDFKELLGLGSLGPTIWQTTWHA
jgi:hypothetical protein